MCVVQQRVASSARLVTFLRNLERSRAAPLSPASPEENRHTMRTFNLFISHSWAYSDSYNRLTALLADRPYFRYRDYSVPRDDPLHVNGTDSQLRHAIRQQMRPCSVVIVLAGVSATYSKWIRKELWMAKNEFESSKPVLAVRPWANKQISTYVREHADAIVGWNTESVVSAIRKMAQS